MENLMNKKTLSVIISLVVIFAVIGGYFLYDTFRINNLNNLIDELNFINKQQVAISNDDDNMVEDKISNLEHYTTKEEMQKAITDIRAYLNTLREKINSLKNNVTTDEAIEYIDNYIARKNLYIELALIYLNNIELYMNDKGISTLTDEDYGVLIDKIQKDSKKIKQQQNVLEKKKNELEKELSILLQQNVLLN